MDRDHDVVRVGNAWRELRRAATSGRVAHRFRATSDGILEIAQVDALMLLVGSGEVRMNELASALRVDASTATRAVHRLVEAGLAQRTTDPSDRRGVVVGATERGKEMCDQLSALGRDALHELLGAFDDREVRRLADLLDRFVAAIDEMATAVQPPPDGTRDR